jgi:hypothetical protein
MEEMREWRRAITQDFEELKMALMNGGSGQRAVGAPKGSWGLPVADLNEFDMLEETISDHKEMRDLVSNVMASEYPLLEMEWVFTCNY